MLHSKIIKQIINKCIANHEEVGAAFVLTKDKKEVLKYSAGMADKEHGVLMNETTICRAFSCSKVATAIAAMILMERGQLDINWDLERILPEFANPFYIRNGEKIPSSRSIKIRDLLNMTSGIPYPGDCSEGIEETQKVWSDLDSSIKEGKSLTTLDFARAIGKCPIAFDAGAQWMYGASADVLGAVIEVISGKRLGVFMEKNIFQPLGMRDTAFFVPKEKEDRLSVLYENGEGTKIFEGSNLCIYDIDTPPAFESGGAGLFSTAADYAKLGAMLANGGESNGNRILGRKTIEFMATNGLTGHQKSTLNWDSTLGYGYANLVRMVEDKNKAGTLASCGSFGWDGWTGTYLLCDPVERISVTLFVQRCGAGTTQLSRNLVNAVYALDFTPTT